MNWFTSLGELARVNHELLRLAKTALVLLKEDNLPPLDKVWIDRARLGADLAGLGARLRPIFAAWDKQLAPLGPGQKSQANRLVEEIRISSKEILALDEESRGIIEGFRGETRDQLDRLNTGRRLIQGYAQAMKGSNMPSRISKTG